MRFTKLLTTYGKFTIGEPGVMLLVFGRMRGDIFVGVPTGIDVDEGRVVATCAENQRKFVNPSCYEKHKFNTKLSLKF